jgi:hypothetical protein
MNESTFKYMAPMPLKTQRASIATMYGEPTSQVGSSSNEVRREAFEEAIEVVRAARLLFPSVDVTEAFGYVVGELRLKAKGDPTP